jgi:hypothetical protein
VAAALALLCSASRLCVLIKASPLTCMHVCANTTHYQQCRCQTLINWLRCVSLGYLFRCLTVTLTSLPGPAPHCMNAEVIIVFTKSYTFNIPSCTQCTTMHAEALLQHLYCVEHHISQIALLKNMADNRRLGRYSHALPPQHTAHTNFLNFRILTSNHSVYATFTSCRFHD